VDSLLDSAGASNGACVCVCVCVWVLLSESRAPAAGVADVAGSRAQAADPDSDPQLLAVTSPSRVTGSSSFVGGPKVARHSSCPASRPRRADGCSPGRDRDRNRK
jgi:hypothetical protein